MKVGHHSEAGHRRAIAKADAAIRRSIDADAEARRARVALPTSAAALELREYQYRADHSGEPADPKPCETLPGSVDVSTVPDAPSPAGMSRSRSQRPAPTPSGSSEALAATR
ncbi:MAG: hypothetical protein U5N53_02945 [Mycobacterium sp.]|nr:hypothetical protein [Mycobacterium sp.]